MEFTFLDIDGSLDMIENYYQKRDNVDMNDPSDMLNYYVLYREYVDDWDDVVRQRFEEFKLRHSDYDFRDMDLYELLTITCYDYKGNYAAGYEVIDYVFDKIWETEGDPEYLVNYRSEGKYPVLIRMLMEDEPNKQETRIYKKWFDKIIDKMDLSSKYNGDTFMDTAIMGGHNWTIQQLLNRSVTFDSCSGNAVCWLFMALTRWATVHPKLGSRERTKADGIKTYKLLLDNGYPFDKKEDCAQSLYGEDVSFQKLKDKIGIFLNFE